MQMISKAFLELGRGRELPPKGRQSSSYYFEAKSGREDSEGTQIVNKLIWVRNKRAVALCTLAIQGVPEDEEKPTCVFKLARYTLCTRYTQYACTM